MMSSKGCFLLQTSDGWQIANIDSDEVTFHQLECEGDVAPDMLARTVEKFVNDRGLSNKNIVIGVSSTSTLVGSFRVNLEDQRNRRTLMYELEHLLPFAAEEIVADFICSGEHVFGAAVVIETWLPIVIELEVRGLRVQSISPAALMAMQSYLNQAGSDQGDLVLWQDNASLDLFCCRDKTIGRWWHWNEDPHAAARQLAVESLSHSQPLRCDLINATDSFAVPDCGLTFQNVETSSLADHAYRSAAAVLEGSASPLVELRREELTAGDPNRAVRGSMQLLYVAAAVFLLAMSSVFWIKSIQYQRRSDELQQQQVAAFGKAFPESRVPAAVLSRLRSEHAKLVGARSGQSDVELPVSALHVLFEFLSALPENQRYRFRECRIEDGKVDLDVELRSHNDANVLVDSFENRGFSVSPPTTVQQGQRTVSSRIFADIRAVGGTGGE